MTWCLVRDPAGSAFIELDKFVRETDTVVNKFRSHREASDALKAYRDRRDREEAIAAGQMDMFGEGA